MDVNCDISDRPAIVTPSASTPRTLLTTTDLSLGTGNTPPVASSRPGKATEIFQTQHSQVQRNDGNFLIERNIFESLVQTH